MQKLSLLLLTIVILPMLSCSNIYSLNPNYNSKAKVLAHKQFENEFVGVVKTADKEYLVIGDDKIRSFNGNKDTMTLLAEDKFEDKLITHSRLVDGKLLIVTVEKKEITLNYLNPGSLAVIEKKSIPLDEKYRIDDIKVSSNNKYTSLLIRLPDHGLRIFAAEGSEWKDPNSYMNIVFDNTLSIVSQKRLSVEKDICDDDKYDFKNFVGHYVTDAGTAFMAAPILKSDKWDIKTLKFERNNLTYGSTILPKEVAKKNVFDEDYEPLFSIFTTLRDGSIACATLINEGTLYMTYMNITIFNTETLQTVKQTNYRIPEDKAKEIYDNKNASVVYFPALIEGENGDLVIFCDALEEANYGSRSKMASGNDLVYTMTWLNESTYYPISILGFSKDLNFKWIKSIKRDCKKFMNSLNNNIIPLLSADNMIYCEPTKDGVFFVYCSDEANDPKAKDATYCYRTIGMNGEMTAPEPLFQSSYWTCLAGSKVYIEKDGSFSYFTSYRTTMGETYNCYNVLIK